MEVKSLVANKRANKRTSSLAYSTPVPFRCRNSSDEMRSALSNAKESRVHAGINCGLKSSLLLLLLTATMSN